MELTFLDHLFFLLIGIIIPLMSLSTGPIPDDSEKISLPQKKHLYISNTFVLIIGAAIALTLWNINDRDFEILGFHSIVFDWQVVIFTIALVLIYAIDIFLTIKNENNGHEQELRNILPLNWEEYIYFIPLAFAAGICEEIVYRGYLMNYFIILFKNSLINYQLALIVPALLFSISHLYQGWTSVIKIILISLLFSLIFLKSESLLLVMTIHIFIDLVSGYFAMKSTKVPNN
jgi:membrane protease YdiL (CAAX protease family)